MTIGRVRRSMVRADDSVDRFADACLAFAWASMGYRCAVKSNRCSSRAALLRTWLGAERARAPLFLRSFLLSLFYPGGTSQSCHNPLQHVERYYICSAVNTMRNTLVRRRRARTRVPCALVHTHLCADSGHAHAPMESFYAPTVNTARQRETLTGRQASACSGEHAVWRSGI